MIRFFSRLNLAWRFYWRLDYTWHRAWHNAQRSDSIDEHADIRHAGTH